MAEIERFSHTDFENTIKSGVTLIDFNAPWCTPCRALEPVITELGKAYKRKAAVLKVNIDEHREIAANLGIQSIPTIIIFKEGREKKRFIGLQAAETLHKALKEAIA